MDSYSLADAQARLAELIDKVEAGESVEITRQGKPVARVVPTETPKKPIDWDRLKRLTDSQPMHDNPLDHDRGELPLASTAPNKAVDWDALERLRAGQRMQREDAGTFIRRMRDENRY